MSAEEILPKEDEVAKLPRLARLALSARCTSRMRPFYSGQTAFGPLREETILAADKCIKLARDFAHSGMIEEVNVKQLADETYDLAASEDDGHPGSCAA